MNCRLDIVNSQGGNFVKKSRILSMMLLFIFMCLPLASAQRVNMSYLNGDKNFPSVYASGNAGNAFID